MKRIVVLFLAMAFLASAVSAGCPQGMVSYWTFDNGTAVDSVGTNDGTIYGATPVAGIVGNAMSFDGSENYISFPDSPSLDIQNAVSMAMWIKADTDLSNYEELLTKRVWGAGGTSANYQFFLNTGTRQLSWWKGTIYSSGWVPTVGNWTFIAVTVGGGNVKFYVNGVLQSTISDTIGPVNVGDLYIGSYYKSEWESYHGLIDDVALFNRSLSASEVQEMYQKGMHGIGYCGSMVPIYSDFNSSETTNFSAVNITSVDSPVLANSNAEIAWQATGLNLAGADLDSHIQFGHNYVHVDSAALPQLNTTATITMEGVSYPSLDSYNVLVDGAICTDCNKISANPVEFTVQHFSNYTTEPATGAAVPEFNVFTLSLGMIAVLAGLLLVRRRKEKP